MQRILLSILFFCCFVSVSFSQIKMTMSVRAGVNVSSYKYDFAFIPSRFIDPFSKANLFTIGVPLEINFSRHFALQGELNFIQKGYSYKFETASGSGFLNVRDGTFLVNWLEIPILAKVKLGAGKEVKLSFFFGPSVGYGLSGESKSTTTNQDSGITTSISSRIPLDFNKDGHSRVDVGLNLGTELDFGAFYLDARYQLGVTNLTSQTTFFGSKQTAKSRGFAVTVGYRFPIGVGTVKEVKTSKK
jgi:hypothetical protein